MPLVLLNILLFRQAFTFPVRTGGKELQIYRERRRKFFFKYPRGAGENGSLREGTGIARKGLLLLGDEEKGGQILCAVIII